MTIQELNEKKTERAKILRQQRELLDKAQGEKRELVTEERTKYEALDSDFEKLTREIQDEEELRTKEASLAGQKPLDTRGADLDSDHNRRDGKGENKEYRDAFLKFLRTGERSPILKRSVDSTTDASGGYLVPDDFEASVLEKKKEAFIMRQLANVIRSSHNRNIPMEADNGQSTWIDELGTYLENDITFGKATIEAWKVGRIIKVSEEVLIDTAIPLIPYIATRFARTNGEAEEAAFINGDGVKKPTGFIGAADVGHVAASASAFTADELIDLCYSLGDGYRLKATWLMAGQTLKAIRKLKDGNGNYLFSPGLKAGEPDVIEKRPIRTISYMPAIEASAKPIAFGDFSYYQIVDREGFFLQKLIELYAGSGQVGFRGYQRVDGKLMLGEAVKTLQMAV